MRAILPIVFLFLLSCGAKTGLDDFYGDADLLMDVTVDTDGHADADADVEAIPPPHQHLSLGTWLSCAIDDDRLRCWGVNHNGQVGDGSREDRWLPTEVALSVETRAVAAGQWHACALDDTGQVWCWGRIGNMSLTPLPAPMGIGDAIALASGPASACAVHRDGGVSCWGSTWERRGGTCLMTGTSEPLRVPGTGRAVAVAVGNGHQCLIRANGTLHCWGCNAHGKLGIGTNDNPEEPTRVPGLEGVVEVSLANEHSCALLENGRLFCWGLNNVGQLGNGTTTDRDHPVEAQGVRDAVSVAAGGAFSTCVVLDDGRLQCAGAQPETCEDGGCSSGSGSTRFVDVTDFTDVIEVRIGSWHYCARRRDDTLSCWGDNYFGQVGDGTQEFRPDPVDVLP